MLFRKNKLKIYKWKSLCIWAQSHEEAVERLKTASDEVRAEDVVLTSINKIAEEQADKLLKKLGYDII